ncbi:universal stress protein [Paenibacillus sambharensis]|uniref:Universal stress protein n=1 Tax=Paenibacillus sambharensis TaxID=1803190 RepID=A0A2W1LBU3_9BACL|nr:DUF2249 domain-containing protein [Paenibacillus sambharensis]PZD95590.1 universal stress protein [Paenibacillus sambharensis]
MGQQPQVIELDVRPHLRKKLEPFQIIMDTVKSLDKSDTFVLHATFKPTPLLVLLKGKGYRNKVEQVDKEHWVVTFIHKSRKDGFPNEEGASEPGTEEKTEQLHDGADTDSGEPQVFKLDNRGLQPPQPMVRTLAKLQQAKPGDTVVIHNDRVPMFLIEELQALGFSYEVEEQEDGTAVVAILKTQ